MTRGKTITQEVPVKDRVKASEKLAYSIGFAGKDGFTTIVNSFLMMFFMQAAGLNMGFVGTMMLAARIWDAFNDPILGAVADHTNTRWGKFRPYILTAIPMALVFVALFFVPDISDMGKMVYYTIFYVIYGMLFTVLEVPYFGLVGAMTHNPQERASITAWSRIISRIPAFVLPILLGWLTVTMGEARGYVTNAIIVGIIAIVTAIIAFVCIKERAVTHREPSAQKHSGFRDFINVLKGNTALLIVMLIQLFFTFNMILSDMLNPFFITYSLGSPGLITGIGVGLIAVGAMIGQFFYPRLLGRFESCKTIMIVCVPIYVVLLAACYFASLVSVPLYLVMIVAANLFTGAIQINVVQMCFEVCDKLEYKNHVRSDASVFAIVSFLMKLAAGLSATIAGWGLVWAGFQGMGPVMGEVTQTMADRVAIVRFVLPIGLALLSLLLSLLYPIKKDEIVEIRDELASRHEHSDDERAAREQQEEQKVEEFE